MTTEELIARIGEAAGRGNWQRVQALAQHLLHLVRVDGRPLADGSAVRLVEALAAGVPTGASMTGGVNQETAFSELRSILMQKPIKEAALRASWDAVYGALADPTFYAEEKHKLTLGFILKDLRAARRFDLLGKTADRVLARFPEDFLARSQYAQALIDQGQLQAAIEFLDATMRAVQSGVMTVDAKGLAEIRGLLGRAHKQIYVDQIPSSKAPAAVKQRFAAHLQKAIDAYAVDYKADPKNNYWQGINLVALLRLAAQDEQEVHNPAGKPYQEIAKDIAQILEAQADTGDQWMFATLAEAYLAIGDRDKAAKSFGKYLERKPDDFALHGTTRQLEQVFRIEAGAGEAGAILATLKEAQIAQREGRFTLDGDTLQRIKDFAETPQHQRFRESMVPNGDFVGLKLLQTVVARAQAVAAMCDETGKTQGTGFILRAGDLFPGWGDDLVIISNAHVVSCKERPGYEADAPLTPRSVRIVLEGTAGLALTCESKARWQSAINQHDACVLTITNPEVLMQRGVAPLPLCGPETYLQPGDPDKPETMKSAAKVSVIGYPKGGPLSLSFVGNINGANGPVVGVGARTRDADDPVYLHYRAPTEPGNSGSPIFETVDWTVVGLHHEGFNQFDGRPKLKGEPGRSFANEGISIQSIRRAIKVRQ